MYKGPINGTLDKATALATQKWLSLQGFNPGPEDGVWGSNTSKALQRFLNTKGYDVEVDGSLQLLAINEVSSVLCKVFASGNCPSVIKTSKAFQQWLTEEGEDIGGTVDFLCYSFCCGEYEINFCEKGKISTIEIITMI